MSSYTSEIVVGSAIVAALGVAAYLVIRPTPAQPEEGLPSTTTQKKQPKKKRSALQGSLPEKPLPPPPAPRIPKVTPPASMPGGFAPLDNDELSAASGSNAGAAKRKKKKPAKKTTGSSATVTPLGGSTQSGTAVASTQQHPSREYSTQQSNTDEGPWTRVESRRKTSSGAPESASDAGVTTSVTEEEGSITEKERPGEERLTLAEKLLPPPAKTAVDDMLEGPKPRIARVLRVPQSYDRPSGTAEWGDYEDAEDVRGADPDTDDGWSVVPEKAKKSARAGGSGYASAASITVAAPKSASGSESQSKNSKKNSKRKEVVKAVKAANEAAQQAALAKHRREQETEKIAEQFKTKSKQSGGMSASVNDKGELVWE